MRLGNLGYYDESIALARSIGEIANLLFLFAAEPTSVTDWRSQNDSQRKKEFSPVKIRLRIEKAGLRPPVDNSRYGLMSEVAVHITLSTSPQRFNDHDRPTLGAQFQFEGLMVSLNELGVAVAESAACLGVLMEIGGRGKNLVMESQVLLSMTGQLDLATSRKTDKST